MLVSGRVAQRPSETASGLCAIGLCPCAVLLCAGVLNESLLMQLGKLPRLAAAAAAGDGEDTDKDAGSEATDVGDLDPMDVS